ncbi:MAG: IS110 family transposase [Desulfobacteraceae bacterium]|nr:IS110 family transposase [Desulfobacteraceae bacterium]
MKKRNVFQNQSQEILSLFEMTKDRSKVMCIPIDYAKKDHVVMFCNGNGRIIRKPFSINNSREGKDYLLDQVKKSCRHHGISLQHIVFGGEDCGSYADNFISTLRSESWLVAGVNAHDAKTQRENVQASTDRLDLLGISKMILNCRGNCSPAQSGDYLDLRTLMRQRRKMVNMTTGVKNKIHTIVDQIFPGFLNEKNSGILPFSQCSLLLMEDRFSVHQIIRRKRSTLIKLLTRCAIHQPDNCAKKLQQYATQVLKPPENHLVTLQISLKQQVKLFNCLQESTEQLEKEVAESLAQTQGAFLTSIRGIGIILAAGVCAEIGNPNKQKSLSNLVSYSGIIPKVKQTGGTQGKSQTKKVGKRCNRILKDYLVQSASHIGLHGPEELMSDYKRRDTQGQHADFGMGRRYLRMAIGLMRTSQTYLPKSLRGKKSSKKGRGQYYLMSWPKLREKWRTVNTLDIAFDKDMPLGQWRNIVQELYGIELKL